jgi:hypothetical protein
MSSSLHLGTAVVALAVVRTTLRLILPYDLRALLIVQLAGCPAYCARSNMACRPTSAADRFGLFAGWCAKTGRTYCRESCSPSAMASAILALVKSLDTGRTRSILIEVAGKIRVHNMKFADTHVTEISANILPTKTSVTSRLFLYKRLQEQSPSKTNLSIYYRVVTFNTSV